MTDSEKWAWWTLAVVALTTAAYFAFVARFGSQMAATALLALTALPSSSRRYFQGRRMDEREREIAAKALLAGFRSLWVAFIAIVLAIGFAKGWDTSVTLPVWRLEELIWWCAMLLLAVEAATTLVLYRRGAHA
jgi:hypothetical protein